MKRKIARQSFLDKYELLIFCVMVILIFTPTSLSLIQTKVSKDELSEYIKKKEFIIFDNNFYLSEKADITYRWLSGNATITLVIPYDQIIKLEFVSWSYNIPRTVKVYLNNYSLTELNLMENNRTSYTSPFIYLRRGIHKLKFIISDECQIPALIEDKNDTRCLSIGLGEFRKIEADNLISDIDDQGWYGLESYYGKDMRWMGKEGAIKLINLEKGDFTLEFSVFSFYKNREVKVYTDEKLIRILNATPDVSSEKINMSLDPGLHTIRFVANNCDSPYILGINNDQRCLSVAIVRPIIYE